MATVEPYLGEIRLFGGGAVPNGWSFCAGQGMAISGNEALYSLIGTTYGGNGSTTFNLPNLQCRVPIHPGAGHPLGETGGQQQVALTQENLPAHAHIVTAAAAGGSDDPTGNSWGQATQNVYSTVITPVQGMNPMSFSASGGGQPHDNMIPYAAISYIIALVGIYPSHESE